MSGDLKTVRLIIEGDVQGVGFRAFAVDEASRRKISGWVRNRRDGSVEAVAAGAANRVEDFIAVLRKGPPAARVTGVKVFPAETPGVAGFLPWPTV